MALSGVKGWLRAIAVFANEAKQSFKKGAFQSKAEFGMSAHNGCSHLGWGYG